MLAKLISKYEDDDFHKSKEILFVDYLKYWVKSKQGSVENNTWKNYDELVKNHIIPYFGLLKLKVEEIKPRHLMLFYDCKSKSGRLDGKEGGVSQRVLKYFSTIFCQVFKKAVLEQIINNNPALNVSPPKTNFEKPVRQFLDCFEAQKLINLFDGHIIKPIVVIALYYGLRRSEILGLKWDAIDFQNNTMKIKRTLIRYNGITEERERTKNTSSLRTLGLIPEPKELFLNLKKEQEKNKCIFGREYNNSDYVFTQADGAIINPDYVTRNFLKVLHRADFKRIRFHDLRHSCASLLKAKGMDVKDIQMWLGHSDIKTTMNIYTHITEDHMKDLAHILEGTFSLKVS